MGYAVVVVGIVLGAVSTHVDGPMGLSWDRAAQLLALSLVLVSWPLRGWLGRVVEREELQSATLGCLLAAPWRSGLAPRPRLEMLVISILFAMAYFAISFIAGSMALAMFAASHG